MWRIIAVIASPMIGSAIGSPAQTMAALRTTPALTRASLLAWAPSAMRAGLLRRCPAFDRIFAAIQEELRSQYSLAYVSDRPVGVNEFRHIQLATHQKGLVVQARDRYFAHH